MNAAHSNFHPMVGNSLEGQHTTQTPYPYTDLATGSEPMFSNILESELQQPQLRKFTDVLYSILVTDTIPMQSVQNA